MDDPFDPVWKALADPTRRAVLDELRDGPRTTGALAERFPEMTRFGVMKHLGVLEAAGLITAERRGRERWNHLNAVPLRRIYERWVSRYEDRLAGSLLRLKETSERKRRMGVKLLDQPARVARVQCSVTIDAPRGTVFRAWFDDTRRWFFDNEEGIETTPFFCEERIGGRFYQELPNGGFNVLAEVTMIKPGEKIRLRGDCTMPDAVLINMTVSFEDADAGTRVTVDHRMAGEFADDLPAGFEEGWADGLVKLKALVEAGRA